MTRLTPILGFRVKIVERTGSTLKSHFPQSSLWDGAPCGREGCITCTQGAEMLPPCTRKSLVYENVCSLCNKGAGAKGELKDVDPLIPSIYVGETSRTIQERAREHWAATKGSKKDLEGSHMAKHMQQYHEGREPQFMMRVVEFHRSALSRQTGEAVRIMRRGGAGSVLNSRAEFNRCYIPRLKVEEQDKIKEMEQLEMLETQEVGRALKEQDVRWEKGKSTRRTSKELLTGGGMKRENREQGGSKTKKRRKLKFELVEDDWGAAKTIYEEQDWNKDEEQEAQSTTELPTQLGGAGSSEVMVTRSAQVVGARVTILDMVTTATLETVPTTPATQEGTGHGRVPCTTPEVDRPHLGSPRCVRDKEGHSLVQNHTFVDDGGGVCGDISAGGGNEDERGDSASISRTRTRTPISAHTDVTTVSPAPSVCGNTAQDIYEEDISGGGCNDNSEGGCDILKKQKYCVTHKCDVKWFDVTAKKWQYIKSKSMYGYVHRKVRNYVCSGKNTDVRNLHDMRKLAGIETDCGEKESSGYAAIGTATGGNNGPGSGEVESESLGLDSGRK